MIGIIDYRAGNSNSVRNACDKLGIPNTMVHDNHSLESVNSIILPGVGSAQETMDSLRELALIDGLEKRVIKDKVPFLGICVGMQILFECSEEGNAECLGWLKGRVKKFNSSLVRIPQMGWNNIEKKKSSELLYHVANDSFFYFVNSYHVVPEDQEDVLAETVYGDYFVSMIEHNNIFASQFHIEKSGNAGLQILKNFSRIGGI